MTIDATQRFRLPLPEGKHEVFRHEVFRPRTTGLRIRAPKYAGGFCYFWMPKFMLVAMEKCS